MLFKGQNFDWEVKGSGRVCLLLHSLTSVVSWSSTLQPHLLASIHGSNFPASFYHPSRGDSFNDVLLPSSCLCFWGHEPKMVSKLNVASRKQISGTRALTLSRTMTQQLEAFPSSTPSSLSEEPLCVPLQQTGVSSYKRRHSAHSFSDLIKTCVQ